jgi:IS5 family transposase
VRLPAQRSGGGQRGDPGGRLWRAGGGAADGAVTPWAHQTRLAADKGYDTRDFVADIRFVGITPHVAQNIQDRRRSAIDGRTARHQGYGKSINARKRIEQVFGWIKQAAGLRQLKARGRSRVGAVFRLHVVAYNLIRLTNLLSPRDALA